MSDGWDNGGRTLASLRPGEALQFKCGHCGRKGQVTVTELRFRRIPYTTPIAAMVARVVCKKCGMKSAKTKVWARGRG
jgi:C4-type Zn-finger protein